MTRTFHPARPLTRAHMPSDFSISLGAYTQEFTTRIPNDFGPLQNMEGFEPAYRNIVDYIVRITHRIWEAREVEYIAASYSSDCKVFDDFGLQGSNAKIIADTHHTVGAFPDIMLDAKEVIWAGDAQIGFHTSHRVRMLGTNTGPSKYGLATGRKLDTFCIANCVARGNEIYLEHVLYNTCAMLADLGIDTWSEAERLARDPMPGWPRDGATWAALRSEARPPLPLCKAEPVNGFDPDRFTRDLHDALWQNGDISVLETAHADNVPFHGATHRQCSGRTAYAAMIIELRDCLSDIQFQVDEVYWMGNDADGYLISTRWSMEANHTGEGHFGAPCNAPLQIWGITQSRAVDGRLQEEWMLFNELDVMIQIAKARMG